MGSVLSPGRSHPPRGNKAHAPQLLSPGAVTRVHVLPALKTPHPRARAPPREACAPQLESSPRPRSLQLEKSLPRKKIQHSPKQH